MDISAAGRRATPHLSPLPLSKGDAKRHSGLGFRRFNGSTLQRFNARRRHHSPSGVVTSVPDGGLKSKLEDGTAARVWFEYVVTIRSPFGSSISVRSTRKLSLIRRSSFRNTLLIEPVRG